MELRINKSGSKVVHAGHMTDETPISECGSGEQYNGLNRSKPWKRLPEDTEVTCKKCLKKLAESETETAEILEDADTMNAIAEAEAETNGIKAMVTRDAPGVGYVNLDTTRINTAVLVRIGKRWELRAMTGAPENIRARSIAKAVKAWAKRLGLMLDDIVIEKEF